MKKILLSILFVSTAFQLRAEDGHQPGLHPHAMVSVMLVTPTTNAVLLATAGQALRQGWQRRVGVPLALKKVGTIKPGGFGLSPQRRAAPAASCT
jgi:hypothetical protein